MRGAALGAFLGLVTSALLVLAILEVGFRLLPIPGAKPVVTINEPHSELGWVKRAGDSTQKKTSEFDITFEINDLGLRDDADLTRNKPAGTKRALVVGDSFVLGYTVSRDDLFVDRVERAFQASNPSIQVLNGGTEGYATDQELVWLRKEGLTFDPDVVVLCFYQNDVYWNGQKTYAGKPKPRFPAEGNADAPETMLTAANEETGWWAKNTAVGGFLHTMSMGGAAAELIIKLPGGQVMPKEETVVLNDAPGSLRLDDCWSRTAAALRGFKKTCDEAGAKLLFVAIPSREQVQPDSRAPYFERYGLSEEEVNFDQPTEKALALASSAGIPVLNPLEDLRKSAADGPMYFEKDWHLNEEGNRVLAQAIYQRLAEDEYFGGGAKTAGTTALSAPGSKPMPVWPFVVGTIWLILGVVYTRSYKDESAPAAFLKVGALVGTVTGLVLLFHWLSDLAGPTLGAVVGIGAVVLLFGFLLYKSRGQMGIIREVYGSFLRQGHWYMIPLLVAMLTIGGLLVVASSSPFVAPFIYTLF